MQSEASTQSIFSVLVLSLLNYIVKFEYPVKRLGMIIKLIATSNELRTTGLTEKRCESATPHKHLQRYYFLFWTSIILILRFHEEYVSYCNTCIVYLCLKMAYVKGFLLPKYRLMVEYWIRSLPNYPQNPFSMFM